MNYRLFRIAALATFVVPLLAQSAQFYLMTPIPGTKASATPEAPATLAIVGGPHNFGAIYVDSVSAPALFTVSNVGSRTATGLAISPPSGFQLVDNACPSVLTASASCGFAVQFAPLQAINYAGDVIINSNASELRLPVSGEGEQTFARLTLSTNNLDFSEAGAGEVKLSPAVTITNTGSRSAQGLVFTPSSAHFAVVNNTCGSSLDVGASCSFQGRFQSTEHGVHQETLEIDGASMDGVVLPLAASVTVDFEVTHADFGAQSVTSYDTASNPNAPSTTRVTFTNTSDQPVSVTGFEMVAPFAAHMDASLLRYHPVCQNVAPGESCNLRYMSYQPNYGVFDANVKVSTTIGSRIINIKGRFTGATASASSATGETSPYSFGDVPVGSYAEKTFILRNSGKMPITPTFVNGFTTQSMPTYKPGATLTVSQHNCPASLDIGQSCTFVARFAPTTTGLHNSSVGSQTARYIFLGYPVGFYYGAWSLNLSGTGIAP